MKRALRYEVPVALLVDRRGSMVPFHHLSDQFIKAVNEQAGTSVRYFQNVFERTLFRTAYLTEPESFAGWISKLRPNTLVIILSDAGAARGLYNGGRVTSMTSMVKKLDRFRTVWLNPMPRSRWRATSAIALADDVPMYAFDEVEIGAVVKTLNGQLIHQR